MQSLRIGEVLCRMGVIDEEDVDRILAQQRQTRQKFGQIARRLGLVTQEQIWEAWARQLAEREGIELMEFGTDTAALDLVSPGMARRWGIAPLRLWGTHLVVAAPPDTPELTLQEVARIAGCQIHVCVSDRASIRKRLDYVAQEVYSV